MDKIEYWLTLPIIQVGDYTLQLADLASAMGIIVLTFFISKILTRAATLAGERTRAQDQNIYVVTGI